MMHYIAGSDCVFSEVSDRQPSMAYKVKKKIPELTLPTVPGDPGMSPSEMYV